MNLPPHSVEAEEAVIGACLIDTSAYERVADIVSAEQFYRHENRVTWQAVCRLANAGKPVDVLTLSDALGDEIEDAGGRGRLGSLAMHTPSSANVRSYARIIADRYQRREMIRQAARITEQAYDADNASDALAEAQSALMQIGVSGGGPVAMRDVVTAWMAEIDERANSAGGVTGIATGYRDLDQRTTGLHPGNLVVIAGRPAMGKTAFGCGIAANVARAGRSVLVFSMEMSREEIAERAMASESRIPLHALRSARLEDADWSRLGSSVGVVNAWPIHIDDTPALKITQIRARARRHKTRHGLDLVVVDYLSLAQGDGENRTNQVGDVSRGLKALAKELRVPVIALSQLSRRVEERSNKRPILADLRESGQVAQDADLIVFLYRDEEYNPDSPDKGLAEVIIGKQRNGPTGKFPMVFLAEVATYADAEQGTVLTASSSNVRRISGRKAEAFNDV